MSSLMRKKFNFPSLALSRYYKIFLGLAILEGFLAFWFLFRIPSESRNVTLAGYSMQRFGTGFIIILALIALFFLLFDLFGSRKLLKYITIRIDPILKNGILNYIIESVLILIMLVSLTSIMFFLLPLLQRLIFFLPDNYIFATIGQRAGLLIGWIFLISLKVLILFHLSRKQIQNSLPIPVRLAIIAWVIEASIFIYFVLWSLIARKVTLEILTGLGFKILLLTIWFSFWAFLNRRKELPERIFLLFTCISIWLCVFIVSLQFAEWFDAWNTPAMNYFNILADAFLHGKLYLSNPANTGDLTFYKGHWFVAEPPFPAILMLPLIAIWGVQAFNTTTFSLMLAALAAVAVYLILHCLI